MTQPSLPILPDYKAACLSNVVPELVKALMGRPVASWVPSDIESAEQIVLLMIDGLGWEQLKARETVAPTLSQFSGGPITAVAPTTTAACLTSTVVGRPPAAHGILGYRMVVDGDVLNVLKWTNSKGDAIESVVPETFQTQPAFAANPISVVTRRHFIGSGFTRAHLQGANVIGYAAPSSLPVEIWRLAGAGEQLVYAYYDGVDTIAHMHGFGEHYDAELYTVDRLVRDILAGLPGGAALAVVADHGQIEVDDRIVTIDSDVASHCRGYSGEGRFRWLHANAATSRDDLANIARERHGDEAWVLTVDEMSDNEWFGGPLDERARARLGDVALVAREPVAFEEPGHDGERQMVCRHGSLTSSEILVPFLARRV